MRGYGSCSESSKVLSMQKAGCHQIGTSYTIFCVHVLADILYMIYMIYPASIVGDSRRW